MKELHKVVVSIVVFLCLTACGSTSAPDSEPVVSDQKYPASIKGYELYSWQADDAWQFTLITGTNRNKSYDEILSDRSILSGDSFVQLRAEGIENLKKVLEKLYEGETIYWADGSTLSGDPGTVPKITFPSDHLVANIQAFCVTAGLKLYRVKQD